jgi:uncharacterized membrane protein
MSEVVTAGINSLAEPEGGVMAHLICLVSAFLIFRILGLEWHYLADWHIALRAALGAMFLLTASAHWGKRRTELVRMVPESMGNAPTWVSVTGFAEIAIAAGLQIPGIALWAAGFAVIMLCCLFPANVKAAREHLTISHRPVMPVAPRFILQIIFIAVLIGSVWPG